MASQDGAGGRPRWVAVAVGIAMLAIVGALAVFAYRGLFSNFSVQDDDGYVIVSLRLFTDGGALYDDVYSQYGPGLFALLGGAIDLFGISLTSDGARFVNLALWLASTLLGGVALWRLTRSFAISAAGLVLCFFALRYDQYEPLHPGALIGFLLIALVAAATLLPRRASLSLGLIGAVAAVLLTLKVNIGVFAFAAIGLACAFVAPQLRRVTPLRVAVALAYVAVPLVLTASRLDNPDTRQLALTVAIGALGLIAVGWQLRPSSRPDWRDLQWGALTAAVTVTFVVFVILFTGTSPSGLVDGWFVRPAETPDLQYAQLFVDRRAYWWAAAGLLAALVAAWTLGAGRAGDGRWRTGLAAGRIGVGLAIWIALAWEAVLGLPLELTRPLLVATPLAWVAAIPPRGEPSDLGFARVLIPALALLQVLHVFPVPGTQVAWAELTFVFVGAICIADGLTELRAIERLRAGGRPLLRWAGVAAVVAFAAWLCLKPLRRFTDEVSAAHAASVPVELVGADRLRLPGDRVDQLHDVIADLEARCSTFVSIPGLNSFYLWTGQPAPTVLSGPWPFFLTTDDQEQIVEEIRDLPSLCVIRKPDVLGFWAGFSGEVPERPLVRFIRDEFRTVANYSGYYVGVRRRSGP